MSHNNAALITELEEKVEAGIPEECKQFLINYSGMTLDRTEFVRVVNERFSEEMSIATVINIRKIIGSWDFMKDIYDVEGAKIMPFGETLGSPVICIGLSQENYGKIYVFDFDFGLTKIAESLNDFLKSLK